MSTIKERYNALIRDAVREHNDKCDRLAEKGYSGLSIDEHQWLYRQNPEYYNELSRQFTEENVREIDVSKIKVFDYGIAKLYEREQAQKKNT